MSYPIHNYEHSGFGWPGSIPDRWRVARLKTAASYWVSNVDKVPQDGEVPVRLCNYTDVYYNDKITPALSLMETTATPDEVRRFRLRVGDVVITKDSESWDDIGIPALVIESAPDIVCGYHLAILRPFAEQLLGPFLFRVLQSTAVNQQFQVAASGVTRFGLPKSSIGKALIPIPPIQEQQAIAAFLDERLARIEALVEKKRALIEVLQQERTALISWTVTRGLTREVVRTTGLDTPTTLRPSGVDWLGDIPKHWTAGRVKYFARIESGHTPSRSVDDYWVDCTIPWVSLNDSGYLRANDYIGDTAYKINELGLANSSARLLPAGAVVFSRDATVGLCAITTTTMAVSQHFVAYLCGPSLLSKYLLYVLKAMAQHLERLSLGATLATIGMDDIRSLACPIPPLDEQRAIIHFLDNKTARIDSLIGKIELAIERLQEYRTTLLTAAIMGGIDVHGRAASAVAGTADVEIAGPEIAAASLAEV